MSDLPSLLQFAPIVLLAGLVFLVSPLSNVLNVVTVPLGYEWQSCPNCMDVGIRKIERTQCDNCGTEHVTNWGASWYTGGENGDKYEFCDSNCLKEFKSEVEA